MLKRSIAAAALIALSTAATAALPPPTPEQAAAAALAKAKAAHADKEAAYKLCMVQNKVAAETLKEQAAKGKKYTPMATPACEAPGPFVPPAAAPAAKPAAPAAKK